MSKKINMKNFFKYVSLNVLGMIGLSCYILADTFFVSKAFGANGLAALNFSISVYCIISGVGLMVGIGGATKYAIFKSQNEHEKANAVFTHTATVGAIIGIAFAIIGLFFSTPIAKLLGADETVLTMTTTYLTTILCFSPFFILNNVLLAFIRNDGNPKLSMVAMLAGSFSNVVLDYVFMFPLSMGMFGAAFATGLAPVISLGIMMSHFIKHNNSFKLVKCRPKVGYIKDIFGLGLSAFITEVASGVVLIVFNLVIFKLEGNVGVAAYGVVANLALVVTAIFTGISQGIQPLASTGYGMNDKKMLKQILSYAIVLGLCIAVVVYAVTVLFSSPIISAFNSENNASLVSLASNGLKIYFIGFLFAGFNIITAAFLSAIENPKYAFIISIMRGCVMIIPIVFIFTALFKMDGVWLSFVCAEMVTAIITVIFLIRTRRTKKTVAQ